MLIKFVNKCVKLIKSVHNVLTTIKLVLNVQLTSSHKELAVFILVSLILFVNYVLSEIKVVKIALLVLYLIN